MYSRIVGAFSTMNETIYADANVIIKHPIAAPKPTLNPLFLSWVNVVLTIKVIIKPGLNAKLTWIIMNWIRDAANTS